MANVFDKEEPSRDPTREYEFISICLTTGLSSIAVHDLMSHGYIFEESNGEYHFRASTR